MYTLCVSDEPLHVIEATECCELGSLTTSRFRRLFNEIETLRTQVTVESTHASLYRLMGAMAEDAGFHTISDAIATAVAARAAKREAVMWEQVIDGEPNGVITRDREHADAWELHGIAVRALYDAPQPASEPVGYVMAADLEELAQGNGAVISPKTDLATVPLFRLPASEQQATRDFERIMLTYVELWTYREEDKRSRDLHTAARAALARAAGKEQS